MLNEVIPHSTLIVFFNESENAFQLSKRPDGSIIFPSEKGGSDPESNALRGIREEMGALVSNPKITILPGSFAYPVKGEDIYRTPGSLIDGGVIDIALILSWEGQIQNREPKKDLFYWVPLPDVMNTLSLVESKFAFLIVLFELLRLKKINQETLINEFVKAPTLKTVY